MKKLLKPIFLLTPAIAMCFALAGLKVSGVRIQDPDCVGKTYPGYWRALEFLGVRLEHGSV